MLVTQKQFALRWGCLEAVLTDAGGGVLEQTEETLLHQIRFFFFFFFFFLSLLRQHSYVMHSSLGDMTSPFVLSCSPATAGPDQG